MVSRYAECPKCANVADTETGCALCNGAAAATSHLQSIDDDWNALRRIWLSVLGAIAIIVVIFLIIIKFI